MRCAVARAGGMLALALASAWPVSGATRTDAPATNVTRPVGKAPAMRGEPGLGGQPGAAGRGATSGAVVLLAERQRPLEIPDPWYWPRVGAVAAVCLGAVAWGVRWWRRRAGPAPAAQEAPDPGWVARTRILGARRGMSDARWYVGEVSDAVRGYLEARFGLRAPEQTTEEFLEALASKPLPGVGHDGALADFLVQSDLVKFAGWRPGGAELEALEVAAMALVDRTRAVGGVGGGGEGGAA